MTTDVFTDEQVENLNRYQRSAPFHPFTCGSGHRSDEAHRKAYEERGDNDYGLLVATNAGWVCPAEGCGYTQDWAHPFMLNWTEEAAREHEYRMEQVMGVGPGLG